MTQRASAREVGGISLRSVQRIWVAHGLEPHGARFKLSRDPAFAAKLREVVGFYLNPPAHSLGVRTVAAEALGRLW